MKKSLGAKGELFPQSVFIIASYGEDGTPQRHERRMGRRVQQR